MEMQNSVVIPMAENFNDDIVFSTFNLHFCNPCCLGFSAYGNSVKSRDSRMRGDFAAAQNYGTKARRLNIAAVIIGFCSTIILIYYIYRSLSEQHDRLNKLYNYQN